MENYIPISFLNDFIFCPRSIYYHQLYNNFDKTTFNQKYQIKGKAAHQSIDEQFYSKRSDILLNHEVYCSTYNIHGKIDIFDMKTGILTERKRNIKTIYDGYIFQLYAQYFGLKELGYKIKEIKLYSLKTNKSYPIKMPYENPIMFQKFEKLINDINSFDILKTNHSINIEKCKKCIYSNLCDKIY